MGEKGRGVRENGRGVRENGRGVKEKGRGVRENGRGVREKGRGVREKGRGVRMKKGGVKMKGRGMLPGCLDGGTNLIALESSQQVSHTVDVAVFDIPDTTKTSHNEVEDYTVFPVQFTNLLQDLVGREEGRKQEKEGRMGRKDGWEGRKERKGGWEGRMGRKEGW